MGTLALILLPACGFVAAVALVLAYRRGRTLEPQHPWWERPGVWIGLSMVCVLVGVLGFTFLFFPFVVMRSVGRGRRDRRP
jgi:cytochrome bd-type quinol oxidase subunit 2